MPSPRRDVKRDTSGCSCNRRDKVSPKHQHSSSCNTKRGEQGMRRCATSGVRYHAMDLNQADRCINEDVISKMSSPGPGSSQRTPRGPQVSKTRSEVKQLEASMAPLLLKLKQLSIDNMVMRERERMLSLLLEVKERQEQRMRDMNAGVAGNPFALFGLTVPDVQSNVLSALKVPARLQVLASRWSKELDRLQPLLLKYPHLRDPPRNPIPCRPVDERQPCPVIPAILESVTPVDFEERRQLQELGVLMQEGHDVVVAMLYGFLLRPALASLSQMNLQALDGHQGHFSSADDDSNIVAVARDLSQCRVQNRPGGPMNNRPFWERMMLMCANKLFTPPKDHWWQMVEEGNWNDYQRLQSYVLADIVRCARNNVACERAVLAQNISAQPDQAHDMPAGPMCESVIWKSEDVLYQEQRCVSELEATLGKERLLFAMVAEVLCRHITWPPHVPLAFIKSWPYVVDHLALVEEGAARCTPQVLERLLRKDDKRGDGSSTHL